MDREKNRRNIALYGVAFQDVVRIFEGPTLEKIDDRFEYGEVRVCNRNRKRPRDHGHLHGRFWD